MTERRGPRVATARVRRHLAGGLLIVITAGVALMLLAPRVDAAPSEPGPTPSPSASFPTYEPGLEPTAPGLLPPESVNPTPSEKNTQGDAEKNGADKGKDSDKKEPSAKDKKKAEQEKLRREMRKKVKEYKAKHGDGGVLNAFEVTDTNDLPVSAYRIESDAGGVTNPVGQIQSAMTQGLFEGTKWSVAFGCWVITWALQWSLARIFLKPALAISNSLYSHAIVQLGLPGVMMAFSGAVAFWNITFGRSSRGWGELFASTVISALAVSTLAAPPQLLLGDRDGSVGAVGKVRELGIAVYAITTGNEKALTGTATLTQDKTKELTQSVTDGVVDAFIVKPAFLLSYNQQLPNKKCTALYSESRVEQAFFNEKVDGVKDKINKVPSAWDIVPGVVGDIKDAIQNKAVDYVANDLLGLNPGDDFEKACVKDAAQAKKAGWDKVGGAFFIFIAALLMTILLTVTACAYLSTEVRLGIEAILAKVALAAGIMPGAGRAWMWERATTILRLLGLLITLVVGLAIAVQTVTAVLDTNFTGEGGLPAQFVAVDVTVIAAFSFRKRITRRSKAWATQARSRLGNSPLGGRAPVSMDQNAGRKRSLASTLATTALMVGAIAASGGAAAGGAAAGGSGTLSALAGRLGTRAAVRGTAALANGAGKAVVGSAKAAYGMGKFGLKYSAGAPVYLPQAVRAANASVRAVPTNVARSAAQLRSRIAQPLVRQAPAARHFGQTYWNNIGGRWVSNRIRMHRGLPPVPHPRTQPRTAVHRIRTSPGRPMSPRTPVPPAAPVRAPAPRPVRRSPRPMPRQPAASSQQQALRQRLYRMGTDAALTSRPAPSPQVSPQTAPDQPPPRTRPRAARPAPGRRSS
ncbi:hypothetical protein [Streptomyces sp. NPDC057694]|uniref:hypothetical protein n=1 Tax=Streptomyces sp. NPDC057694 TaxID=3346216 RepID=UPI0036AAFF40